MECKTRCGMMKSYFKYVSESGRSSQKLTVIEYNAKDRVFKAIQLRNACEMKMGTRKKDGHYFFAEEVVWMVETGLAVVLYRGVQLSVQECYRLLGIFLVTPEKFFVYSYLKRAGYIVVPYKAFEISLDVPNEEQLDLAPNFLFPISLLDEFPSIKPLKLIMINFLRNPKLLELFGVPEDFLTSNNNWENREETRRNFREILRPRYWPRFDHFSNRVLTWSDYRNERAKILKRNVCIDTSDSVYLPIDYDIYVGDSTFRRNFLPKPIYRLLVVNASFPSVSTLHWLSSQILDGRLLIAVVQQATVVFYNINHQTVCL